MTDDPRFEIKNPEIQKLMADIGHAIKDKMPEGFGFTLFIIEYGEGGALFYISTIQRPDMIKSLLEFIRRQQ